MNGSPYKANDPVARRARLAAIAAWAVLMVSGCSSAGSDPLGSGDASPTVSPSAVDVAALEIRPVLAIAETNAECMGGLSARPSR